MRLLTAALLPLAIIAFLWVAKAVLVPLLLALLLSQLLSPTVERLERHMPGPVAVLLGMGLMATIIFAAVALIGSQLTLLATTLPTISTRLAHFVNGATSALSHLLGSAFGSPVEIVRKGIESTFASSGAVAVSAVSSTVATIGEAALIVILTFLMLYYRRHFRRQLKRLGEMSGNATVGHAIDRTVELGQNYVAGLGMVMVIVGLADTLLLFLIRTPFAAVFGLLGALAVLIPYVGIMIVAPTSAVFVWITTGSLPIAGGVLAVFTVVHFAEGNIISPYLVGAKVNLNPLTTIVSVLIGAQLWGPAGMILFIPLMGILNLAIEANPAREPIARLLGPISEDDIRHKARKKGAPRRWTAAPGYKKIQSFMHKIRHTNHAKTVGARQPSRSHV